MGTATVAKQFASRCDIGPHLRSSGDRPAAVVYLLIFLVGLIMEDLYARLQNRDPQAFEQLAAALVSRDNAARKSAEDFYQQLLTQHPDVVIMFLGAGLSSAQAELKHFCCLYLRKARSLLLSLANAIAESQRIPAHM